MMQRKWIFIFSILYLLALMTTLTYLWIKPTYITDYGRLFSTKIQVIRQANGNNAIQQSIKEATEKQLPLSIAGMQHSMGGQTFAPGAIVLDMKPFNKVGEPYQLGNKTVVTAQAGATWNDVQRKIANFGLAPKVTQSLVGFTVGGSISVNAHGRDIRFGTVAEGIHSIKVRLANGTEVVLSKEDPLFYTVVGGYGLFGVIEETTIELVKDSSYIVKTDVMNYDKYGAYFERQVIENDDIHLHIARISLAEDDSYLKDMYAINYMATNQEASSKLKEERFVAIPKATLQLSRLHPKGKQLFWKTQLNYAKSIEGSIISRNNVMRGESLFLQYEHPNKTEVLQELFIPTENFTPFIDELRMVLPTLSSIDALNITIRYVPKGQAYTLDYAPQNMFAFVFLLNVPRDDHSIKKDIQSLTDVALKFNGTYYLPYMPYQTKQQFQQAYPNDASFWEIKKKFDPTNLFQSTFSQTYMDKGE